MHLTGIILLLSSSGISPGLSSIHKKTKIGIAIVKKILQLIILLVYVNQSTSCGSEMDNKRTSLRHDK